MLFAKGYDGDILRGVTKYMKSLYDTVCDGFGGGHHDLWRVLFHEAGDFAKRILLVEVGLDDGILVRRKVCVLICFRKPFYTLRFAGETKRPRHQINLLIVGVQQDLRHLADARAVVKRDKVRVETVDQPVD